MLPSLLALVLLGQSPVPKSLSPAIRSLANVKQISLAVLMYAQDHKDTLPNANDFRTALKPYLKSDAAFTAPGAPKGAVSYFMEPRLSGMAIRKIASPAETAIVVEGSRGKANFPYRARTVIGFVDGHARLVNAKAAFKARTISLKSR